MSFDSNPPPEDPLGAPPRSPPVEAQFEQPGVTPGTGLPRNIAAALACIFPLVGGIAFYVMDRRDRFVRSYALQSIVLGALISVVSVFLNLGTWLLGRIPFIGWLFVWFFTAISAVVVILFLLLWIPMIWKAYSGKTYEMPFLWAAAKRHIPQAFL